MPFYLNGESDEDLMKMRHGAKFIVLVHLVAVFFTSGAFGVNCTNENERAVRGRVEAIRSVALVPQIEGFVSNVCFSEGCLVKKGDLLYELERQRYQFQVDACAAELLASTYMVRHCQREHDRMSAADSRGITQVEMEATSLQYETAKASERQARSALAIATFDLEKTRIFAPIDGRIGASAVCLGTYVSPIHEPMAQIVQVDPIRVVFPIPAAEYVRIRKSGKTTGQVFKDVRIVLPGGDLYDHHGKVDFENNVINEEDGMIYLGASFPNPDQLLLPNAVVDVLVEKGGRQL